MQNAGHNIVDLDGMTDGHPGVVQVSSVNAGE
jgi:hypothetical protein